MIIVLLSFILLAFLMIALVIGTDREDMAHNEYYDIIEQRRRPCPPATIKSKEEFFQYLKNNWTGFTFSAWDVCPINWNIAKTVAILRSFECNNKLIKVVVERYVYFKLLS